MSTTQPTNIAQALAIRLSNPVVLSLEQRLFRDALQAVEKEKRKQGKLPEFFDNLQHAKTVEDVQYALKVGRESNKIWSEPEGNKWLKHMGRFAEFIWPYKPVLDAVVTRSSNLGAPIWATLAFVLGVFKDIGPTSQSLKHTAQTLEQTKSRFQRYYNSGITISLDTQDALSTYYKTIINFAIEVHAEFAAGRLKTATRLIHRTLKTKLEDLDKTITIIIDDVDKGAHFDHVEALRGDIAGLHGTVKLTRLQPNSITSSTSPSSTRQIQFGLNPVNRSFTGRHQVLRDVWSYLNQAPHGQARAAIYGMGGIGKTQILQKYANDQFNAQPRATCYDTVIFVNARSKASVFNAVLLFMYENAPDELSRKQLTETDFTSFHGWLLEREKWLLIFDNVCDYDDVRWAIPSGNRGHILFSTRSDLIAKQVAPESQLVHVLSMEDNDSIRLVSKLAEGSSFPEDKDPNVAIEVQRYAQGLPLLIEQIVHNALFGDITIRTALQQCQGNKDLLRQKNISSLHEDNLSLGGVVKQIFDLVGTKCDRAEALLTIFAFLEPSSIPMDVVRDGAKPYHEFLDQPHTYGRGAANVVPGGIQERFDRGEQSGVQESAPKKENWWNSTKLHVSWRSRKPKDVRNLCELPIDDAQQRSDLLKRCGPDTPIGRLFANKTMIDDAVVILCSSGIISRSQRDTLTMHDRKSEVAKALIDSESTSMSRDMLITAATMVYLAYPLPYPSTLQGRRLLLNQRLPHALACHQNLKDAGILNDCSIGPELSHLIASTLCANGSGGILDERGYPISAEERKEHQKSVIDYYLQAYEGYLAGWTRLKEIHQIDDQHIYLSTFRDREREKRLGYDKYNHYGGLERYGRSAPWRAMQTAVKLSMHFESNPETLDRAEFFTREALRFYTAVFGENDSDTASMKQDLSFILGPLKKDWQAARDLCIQCIEDFTETKANRWGKKNKPNDELLWETLIESSEGANFACSAGRSCLELSKAFELEGDMLSKIQSANEAIPWLEIKLRYLEQRHGVDFYTLRKQMIKLGHAYELAEQTGPSLYWYGRAVRCSMNKEEYSDDVIAASDEQILQTIQTFEEARERTAGSLQGQNLEFVCGRRGECCRDTPHNELDLRERLSEVETRITQWKAQYKQAVRKTLNEEPGIGEVDWDAVLAQPFECEGQVFARDDCTEIEVQVEVEEGLGKGKEKTIEYPSSIETRESELREGSGDGQVSMVKANYDVMGQRLPMLEQLSV